MPELDDVEFARNPDPRAPVVLLLDTSGSMAGRPIQELNAGLKVLHSDLEQDELASRRVELAIVSFGSNDVCVEQDFVECRNWIPPVLIAGGSTPMGRAIQTALDLLRARKTKYRENGINYYRPWAFLLTDGAPTDGWTSAAERIRQEEASQSVAFFAVGVEGADMQTLANIAPRPPVLLRGLSFQELFLWLSASQKRVSASKVGEQVELPPIGWATV